MTIIARGENKLLTRTLTQANGTALLVSSLTLARVELIQGGVIVATYTRGTNNELRSSGTDALVVELTAAFTASLTPGVLTERYTLHTLDLAFTVDGSTAKHVVELNRVSIV